MRKVAFFLALVACLAFAGSRSAVTNGYMPGDAGCYSTAPVQYDGGLCDGVSLNATTGCRVTVFVADGGTVSTCTTPLWYMDPTVGAFEPSPLGTFSCTSGSLPDGGAPSAQSKDYAITVPYGRLAASIYAASPTGPQVRVECYGHSIPGGNGATY